jgi:hypothetical protein
LVIPRGSRISISTTTSSNTSTTVDGIVARTGVRIRRRRSGARVAGARPAVGRRPRAAAIAIAIAAPRAVSACHAPAPAISDPDPTAPHPTPPHHTPPHHARATDRLDARCDGEATINHQFMHKRRTISSLSTACVCIVSAFLRKYARDCISTCVCISTTRARDCSCRPIAGDSGKTSDWRAYLSRQRRARVRWRARRIARGRAPADIDHQ